jgi:hypothetical protein
VMSQPGHGTRIMATLPKLEPAGTPADTAQAAA